MTLEQVNERVEAWVLEAAPNVATLMKTECLQDVSKTVHVNATVEAVPDDSRLTGSTMESVPLPVTFADFKDLSDAKEYAGMIGAKLDQILAEKLGEVTKTVRANRHEAESALAGNGFYGPYKRLGDFVVAVGPEVIKLVVAARPRLTQLEGRFRIECIVSPLLQKTYRGEVGVEKIQSK